MSTNPSIVGSVLKDSYIDSMINYTTVQILQATGLQNIIPNDQNNMLPKSN